VSTLKLGALALSALGIAYAMFARGGALAGALPDLPEPTRAEGELGAPIARCDAASWLAACTASDVPDIELPSEVEFEPMQRLIAESRAWTRQRDGDALGRMGEIALALDLGDSAAQLFAAAAELGTAHARWNYLRGVALQQQGKLDAAVTALRVALAQSPDVGIPRARIARALFELGRTDEARAEFELCLRQDSTRALGHLGLARIDLGRNDAGAALKQLDAAAALTPGDYVVWTLRAQALAALGRAEESRRDAERASKLPRYRGWLSFDPLLPECNERARTLAHVEMLFGQAQGRRDLAQLASLSDELTRRVPRDPEAWRRAAAAHVAAQRMPAARERIERAVELAPQSTPVLCTAAEIAMASNDPRRALELARRAMASDPRSAFAHEVLGRASFLTQDYAAAITHARRAVELAPSDLDKRQILVEILVALRRNDEALLELETFLAISPAHPWASAQLSALRGSR
jgi:tetratricopeptide (TPR) repeat protein